MSEYKILYDNNTNRVYLKKFPEKKKNFDTDQEKLEYLNNIEKIKNYEKKDNEDEELKKLNSIEGIKNYEKKKGVLKDNKSNENKQYIDNHNRDNNKIIEKINKNNNITEIDASEFFSKFNLNNNSNNIDHNNNNSNGNNDISLMTGPRGMPGLIGPQGPPGPAGESISDEKIVELVKRISNMNGEKSVKIYNKLIYGIKKTSFSDSANYLSNNNNNLKIKQNNKIYDKQLFDIFYLSPNILEVIGNSNNNYIHDKKVELFKSIYDDSDIEYFPLDYLPSGFPINNNSTTNNFSKLLIKNFSWNIMQNISEYEFDGLRLVGYVPNGKEYVLNDIELEISIELHSQSTYELINDRDNIFPYRNKFIKLLNPSNTCINSTKNTKIKISELNGVHNKNIEILIRNHKYLKSYLLCLKVSLTEDSIYFLKGHNKNNEISYGFVPFNQIIVSFDYELL